MDTLPLDKSSEYQRNKELLLKNFKTTTEIGLKKKTSNLFRERKIKQSLDLTSFNKVLTIDTTNLYAEVGGTTTYEDFVKETLRFGCMPAVVPELKSITVGGAATGIGIESSSFKFGFVHETIEEVDILLSSGRVVTCTAANEYKDLFFAFPNSYGSFGYALKLKVKLVRVKPYVHVEHKKYSDSKQFFKEMKRYCEKFSWYDGRGIE